MNLIFRSGVVALAALSTSTYGQQVVRFVTGSAPGGGVDVVARVLAGPMGSLLGKTVIIENKPGASYNIAANIVAKAAPDGNTVLVTFNVHPIAGALHPRLPFDPVKDFLAVGMIATTPYVVVSNQALAGANLKEMLALAKAQGRSPSFATLGIGTPQHLMLERLRSQTGVDIRMIHYKGVANLVPDVIAGHVDFSLLTVSSAEAQVKAGKLKALAVTSPHRMPEFPDTPTVTEVGFQGFVNDGWYAVLLPAKTPHAVAQAYNTALNTALGMPAVVDQLRKVGATPAPGSPDILSRRLSEDAAMWKQVIASNKIKAE